MLEKGQMLKEQYDIREIVGKGGQSVVYRARDMKRKNIEVAVKEMKKSKSMAEDMSSIDFYRQEVMILSQLNHPQIPKIYDIFTESGNLYIIEEYIEGKTLEEFLSKGDRLKPEKALEVAIQVAEILEYLHGQEPPVYFRDLKPANLIMKGTHFHLVDFAGCYIPFMGMGEGVAIRTRGYAPPEAHTTTVADAAFDVYSLGALLYRLATGINVAAFGTELPPLGAKKDKLPGALVRIINKAINPNKMMRYHTIQEMKFELEELKDALGKSTDADKHGVPKMPFGYTMKNMLKWAFLPILDFFVFLFIPLLLLRPALSTILPIIDSSRPMPWYFYLIGIVVLIIHISHRHWLDWWYYVIMYNRHLHKPYGGIRPITFLLIVEILLMAYGYHQIFVLR